VQLGSRLAGQSLFRHVPSTTTTAKRAREGERELHYTDLRKVTLAAALKRLR
jgi:hypothetical protein